MVLERGVAYKRFWQMKLSIGLTQNLLMQTSLEARGLTLGFADLFRIAVFTVLSGL